MAKIAISGASGKTGFRVAEEALKAKFNVRLLIRNDSQLPTSLEACEKKVISLSDPRSIDEALTGCDTLVIATGARPSIDLTGPARVDAFGVKQQVEGCKRNSVNRVLLVSSLCAGRWIHPLNLFGLILIWKRIGEKALEESSLNWTVIRPGGLTEQEENLEKESIVYTGPDLQEEAYIPRRLVAKACIEAIKTPSSIGNIIEITSETTQTNVTMEKALNDF